MEVGAQELALSVVIITGPPWCRAFRGGLGVLEGLRGLCWALQAVSRDKMRDETTGALASLLLEGELVWW